MTVPCAGSSWMVICSESPNEAKLSDGGEKGKELSTDATPPFAGARC